MKGMFRVIKEIIAKQMLSHIKNPDSWFGIKYNMNIYKGCQHGCIYCDSRSECYNIENFDDIIVKTNAVELLEREISRKKVKGTIGTGAMSDPYIPLEKHLKLTRKSLEIIRKYGFPVHIITKSNLVVRDKDILKEINRVYAAVSFTITTSDDELAKKIEPGAPLPSERFNAMKSIANEGIYTGVTMMPILPYIQDNEDNIISIVKKTTEYGGKYILPFMGVTLRDRQRVYYYNKLDKYFPGLRTKYESNFKNKYECISDESAKLYKKVKKISVQYGIKLNMDKYEDRVPIQLSLF